MNALEKLAVTDLAPFMVTRHVKTVPEQAPVPVHPLKV
jgi:hypothetical protein